MKPSEARTKLISMLKEISDRKIRMNALKAAATYLKTHNIVEKKVCKARIITFYSMWLDKINSADKKEKISLLRRLLSIARK